MENNIIAQLTKCKDTEAISQLLKNWSAVPSNNQSVTAAAIDQNDTLDPKGKTLVR